MFELKKIVNQLDKRNFGGTLPSTISSVITDTRNYDGQDCFIAIAGDNFDGFDFVEQVLDKGCKVVVFNNNQKNIKKAEHIYSSYKKCVFISVVNTIDFLQLMAIDHLKQWKRKNLGFVVGITGSNGKTTQKEMLYDILDAAFPGHVVCNLGNQNNHIGVPLTLLKIRKEHKYIIVEMGTNHPGEIEKLCEISMPDAGIITNVGQSHLEFFKTEENVYCEKKKLYDAILRNRSLNKIFIQNYDDFYLRKLEHFEGLVRLSQKDKTAGVFYQIKENTLNIKYQNSDIAINNPNITGEHNLINLVSAFAIAVNISGDHINEYLAAMQKFTPKNNRSMWINKKNKLIYLDAYNANPSSMELSIRGFVEQMGIKKISLDRCLFVLGDMNELGDLTEAAHVKIGKLLTDFNAKNVVCVGKYGHFYQSGFECAQIFSETLSLKKEWKGFLSKNQSVFIKGSRSLQLESLVDMG